MKKNDSLDRFARLAAVARREAAPAVDIEHLVRARLPRIGRPTVHRPLLWFAAASAAAAVVAVLMVLPMLSSMSDPFASMFQAMNTLVQ